MASTAHKTEEEKKEFFDEPKVLEEKIDQLVAMIKNSKHFIAFTGAGISTSTGIPDFRSGINTVLKTGPGAWEKLASKTGNNKQNYKVMSLKAIPSKTHMGFVALEKANYLKFLISQNTDGLHRRSGFPTDKLAELHGNSNLEICKTCKKKYLRDFRVRTAQKVFDHETSRLCDDPKCKKQLYDSIINFGENLPEEELNNGFIHSGKADLCLAMGSSLRVTPAANMPEEVAQRNQNLVIVNLQKTPLDKIAKLKINAFCDQVMEMVMQKLNIPIPDFVLTRRIGVSRTTIKSQQGIYFRGLDSDKLPFSLFPSITVTNNNVHNQLKKEPFFYTSKDNLSQGNIIANLEFQGHYNEPKLDIEFKLQNLKENQEIIFVMDFDPKTQKWIKVTQQQ